MTREEAIVSLGLDTTSLRTNFGKFAGDFRSSINNVAKQWGGAFTAGGIIAGINSVLNKFDDLKDKADNLTISTDFLQGMQQLARKDVVGGVKTFDKAISELSTRLGEAKDGSDDAIAKFKRWGITIREIAGEDAEGMFFRIADKLKAIEDPAVRSAAAFDLLGKAGKNMAGFLAQGSAHLKEMIDGASKLDAKTIADLAKAKDQLEDTSNSLTVYGGKIVALWGKLWEDIGHFSTGFESRKKAIAEEVRKSFEKERRERQAWLDKEYEAENAVEELSKAEAKAAAKRLAHQRGDSPEQLKAGATILKEHADAVFDQMQSWEKMNAIMDNIKTQKQLMSDLRDMKESNAYLKAETELKKAQLSLDKLKTEEAQKTNRALAQHVEKQKRIKDLKAQLGSEFLPTLDQLAEFGNFTRQARRIQFLEGDIPLALRRGNTKLADREKAELFKLRAELEAAGVYQDPNKATLEELKKLTSKVGKNGLQVEIPGANE